MSLWMVRGGRYGEQESVALEKGLICVGFKDVADLSAATDRGAVRELAKQAYPD